MTAVPVTGEVPVLVNAGTTAAGPLRWKNKRATTPVDIII